MDYDIYHDESKEAGYWQGILLVPRETRQRFLHHLEQSRSNTGYRGVVRLKGLDRTSGPRYRCTRGWMDLGVAALIQKLQAKRYPFYSGKSRPNPEFSLLEEEIGTKLVVFRVRDDHRCMEGYPDYGAKVETTFRMGLKGGLHLFGDESHALTVRSFHFDGHEHYGRPIDARRIIGRLGSLRDWANVPDDTPIHAGSSNHTRSNCQPSNDCQLLQLTDIFVGGFRTVLGQESHPAQGELASPLRELARRWHDGYARMRNSKWFKGFCISECYLENGEWHFADLRPSAPDSQLALPGF